MQAHKTVISVTAFLIMILGLQSASAQKDTKINWEDMEEWGPSLPADRNWDRSQLILQRSGDEGQIIAIVRLVKGPMPDFHSARGTKHVNHNTIVTVMAVHEDRASILAEMYLALAHGEEGDRVLDLAVVNGRIVLLTTFSAGGGSGLQQMSVIYNSKDPASDDGCYLPILRVAETDFPLASRLVVEGDQLTLSISKEIDGREVELMSPTLQPVKPNEGHYLVPQSDYLVELRKAE